MITPTLQMWFEPGIWTPERTLDFVCSLIEVLGKSHPSLTEWKDLRQGPKDVAVSLTERDAILARINRKIDRNRTSYPGLPYVESAELNVTNALTPSAWQKPGCATLFFKPWNGLMTLEVCDADESLGAALARQVFLSACRTAISMAPITFASTDIQSAHGDREVSYQFDKKLFPHRQYFGWMGFVHVELSHAQIREADEVVPVPGKGTIIISVPGLLDPADPAQVEQAHRVEMQLAHYNFLPVTDPDLRDAP
ncbi:Imm52 family immunity protein [Xanthomonas oryzae]|nr:Imm52 family immunity protein [Xanthomonas oryzae]